MCLYYLIKPAYIYIYIYIYIYGEIGKHSSKLCKNEHKTEISLSLIY